MNQTGQKNNREIVLLLYNIRSVYNVGSIFRTADCAGVSKVILTGFTPAPIDRFGRNRKDLSKVALGAESSVEWEYFSDALSVIKKLKKEGYRIISVEQDKKSVNYKDINLSEKNLIVLGEETKGVSREILDISDVIGEVKMLGKKESLNVSVTAGVVLFGIL